MTEKAKVIYFKKAHHVRNLYAFEYETESIVSQGETKIFRLQTIGTLCSLLTFKVISDNPSTKFDVELNSAEDMDPRYTIYEAINCEHKQVDDLLTLHYVNRQEVDLEKIFKDAVYETDKSLYIKITNKNGGADSTFYIMTFYEKFQK